jgi:peptidylprolyl isomerase
VSEDQVFARHPPVRGKILVVGIGSVGSLIAEDLAKMGLTLALIDFDILETHNISRHAVGYDHLDEPKALALAAKLGREFPDAEVIGHQANFLALSTKQQLELVQLCDIVIAATDDINCQRRINEICVMAQVPAVYPGIWTGRGTGTPAEVSEILWVPSGRRTPCFLCATSWRRPGRATEARGGMIVEIRVLTSATMSIVLAILEPHGIRASLLNEAENLLLVHSFTPISAQFRELFDGTNIRSVEVPFPAEACSACGRSRLQPADSEDSVPSSLPISQERGWPVAGLISFLITLIVGGCVALWAINWAYHSAAAAGSTQSETGSSTFPPLPPGADPALGRRPPTSTDTGEPTELSVTYLVVGKGLRAAVGNTITVVYVETSLRTGQLIESLWDFGHTLSFVLGTGSVIPGWDRGIVGVPVGSRIQLDIPTGLAYGEHPLDGIPAGPLRFIVDILAAAP